MLPPPPFAGMTPFEAYFGRNPDVSYFCVFGCDAYTHVPKVQRGKSDENSNKLVLIGYNAVSTGYRLFDPNTESISVSRDVIFYESSHAKGVEISLDLIGTLLIVSLLLHPFPSLMTLMMLL